MANRSDRGDNEQRDERRGGRYGDRWDQAGYYDDTASGQPADLQAGGGMVGSGEYAERHMNREAYTSPDPQGEQRADVLIRTDVNDRLMLYEQLAASAIEVEVNHGEVTLKGEVDSQQAKRIAEDAAESVAGVKDIHNQLRVKQD